MLTILTDVRGVCQPVSLSVTRLKSAAARAVYAPCRVRGVIRCSLCQITLTSCCIVSLFSGASERTAAVVLCAASLLWASWASTRSVPRCDLLDAPVTTDGRQNARSRRPGAGHRHQRQVRASALLIVKRNFATRKSVRLSVTLLSHTKTVQDIKMFFSLHHTIRRYFAGFCYPGLKTSPPNNRIIHRFWSPYNLTCHWHLIVNVYNITILSVCISLSA